MSETTLLNASATDALNPNFGWRGDLAKGFSYFQAKRGPMYGRRTQVTGRTFGLQWLKRSKATAALLKWHCDQFENGFFTLADYEKGRYYSGRFMPETYTETPVGYEQWNVEATFVEIPGLAMYAYPNVWGVPNSIFMEEVDDFGNDLAKLTGTWAAGGGTPHGSGSKVSNTLNDTAEWLYYGYGFRVYSAKAGDLGIVAVSVDGGAETNVDLYSAAPAASAVVHTNANLALGEHRVKLRCTHTKNAASTNYYVSADAIEVMR